MKLTNKFGLPDAFMRACQNDPYSKGPSDFSATGLANPARATALIEQFGDQIEIDISTKVASTIGRGVHSILEGAARPELDIIEKRYFAQFIVDDVSYIVSAQIDLFEIDTKTLSDWKTCKAYAFHKKAGAGKKPEWTQQLNVAKELMARNGVEVKVLKIIGLLKDWSKRETIDPGYPQLEIMTVDLTLWEREKTVKYIEDRIRAHVLAKVDLPKCTSAETWGGNRCQSWCDASSVCEQYKNSLKTGII